MMKLSKNVKDHNHQYNDTILGWVHLSEYQSKTSQVALITDCQQSQFVITPRLPDSARFYVIGFSFGGSNQDITSGVTFL